MATPSVAAADMLPRFLLPRLSWNAPLTASRAARPFATLQATNHAPRPWQSSPTKSFNGESWPRRPSLAKQSPVLARAFHATAQRQRDHHFDTLKFVKRLQGEGFTEEQSVAMMRVLDDVIEER
jgi:hypothetical protein